MQQKAKEQEEKKVRNVAARRRTWSNQWLGPLGGHVQAHMFILYVRLMLDMDLHGMLLDGDTCVDCFVVGVRLFASEACKVIRPPPAGVCRWRF